MRCAPREIEKVNLQNAGYLAQKRLARGIRLNAPEAIALISTQLFELARDGVSVAELMNIGRKMLGFNQVVPGVEYLLDEVQVECMMKDGCKLITIHHPISRAESDLELCLRGTFLPLPQNTSFKEHRNDGGAMIPGCIYTVSQAPNLIIHEGRQCIELFVLNTADRAIQVGSHFNFIEANPYLQFNRMAALGYRLNMLVCIYCFY